MRTLRIEEEWAGVFSVRDSECSVRSLIGDNVNHVAIVIQYACPFGSHRIPWKEEIPLLGSFSRYLPLGFGGEFLLPFGGLRGSGGVLEGGPGCHAL